MHVHTYIPPASMTMGRRRTTRRTAERFICEGTIASYTVEVSTLKKTERANLLQPSLEKSANHLTKSEHIYSLNKKKLSLPNGQIHRICCSEKATLKLMGSRSQATYYLGVLQLVHLPFARSSWWSSHFRQLVQTNSIVQLCGAFLEGVLQPVMLLRRQTLGE